MCTTRRQSYHTEVANARVGSTGPSLPVARHRSPSRPTASGPQDTHPRKLQTTTSVCTTRRQSYHIEVVNARVGSTGPSLPVARHRSPSRPTASGPQESHLRSFHIVALVQTLQKLRSTPFRSACASPPPGTKPLVPHKNHSRPIAAQLPDRVRPLVLQKDKGIRIVEMQAQRGGCLQKR